MKLKFLVVLINVSLFSALYFQWEPFALAMNWSAKLKSKRETDAVSKTFETYNLTQQKSAESSRLRFTIQSGKHFWHPQMAIWSEDSNGHLLETYFVTQSSAYNLFYGGRTRENYKNIDTWSPPNNRTIEIPTLPRWKGKMRKKHGISMNNFDGISGATPSAGLIIEQDVIRHNVSKIFLEVNVAFDENKYYSEYDFPEDSMYHGGTGLLGQPSLIYEGVIDSFTKAPVVLQLIGHGHHSGANDSIYQDLSRITTAKNVLDWVLVDWLDELKLD